MRKVALVSCASKKSELTFNAEALYASDLFQKASRLASSITTSWYILSAKHGLLEPQEVIEPYDVTLNTLPKEQREKWSQNVFHKLRKLLRPGDEVIFFAGSKYREFLEPKLREAGFRVQVPMLGLSIGRQLQWLNAATGDLERQGDLTKFYELLERLSQGLVGPRRLAESSGKQTWPRRGLYFFFEPNEFRSFENDTKRVVRVGTHAVSAGSKSTLWNRLRTHKGSEDGRGNHRGSIFRLHVGAAMQSNLSKDVSLPTWGVGQSAAKHVRLSEEVLEKKVSEFLGAMSVLWLQIEDEPAARSDRSYLEKNSIGLLCGPSGPIDLPSEAWLGRKSASQEIRFSGLWNVDYISWKYDRRFLEVLDRYIDVTIGTASPPTTSLAPADWFETKQATRSKRSDQLTLGLENDDG